MARHPGVFPMRERLGITVVFGKTKPQPEGYDAIDPIIEVLVDAGMIEDERQTDSARELQDPGAGERYTALIEPSGSQHGTGS
jgi:hypothetical protein